jgi:ribulose 1,5-bisphosphate synthetase/thiazole synthase
MDEYRTRTSERHKHRQSADVIAICAGAARLAAARELSGGGLVSTMIEERDLIGRRIFTVHDSNFAFPVELAA